MSSLTINNPVSTQLLPLPKVSSTINVIWDTQKGIKTETDFYKYKLKINTSYSPKLLQLSCQYFCQHCFTSDKLHNSVDTLYVKIAFRYLHTIKPGTLHILITMTAQQH